MGAEESVRRQVILAHENGLHLTPITRLVQELNEFQSEVTLTYDGKAASGKSAVELMLLGATEGSELLVEANGADASAAADAAEKILTTVE